MWKVGPVISIKKKGAHRRRYKGASEEAPRLGCQRQIRSHIPCLHGAAAGPGQLHRQHLQFFSM